MKQLGKFLGIVAAAAALAGCATASPPPRVTPLDYLPGIAGDYYPIQSREAGHLYHIYVRVPQDYSKEPTRRYPIVYLLDGDSLYPVVGGSHIFLTIDDKLPRGDRRRDFLRLVRQAHQPASHRLRPARSGREAGGHACRGLPPLSRT